MAVNCMGLVPALGWAGPMPISFINKFTQKKGKANDCFLKNHSLG